MSIDLLSLLYSCWELLTAIDTLVTNIQRLSNLLEKLCDLVKSSSRLVTRRQSPFLTNEELGRRAEEWKGTKKRRKLDVRKVIKKR